MAAAKQVGDVMSDLGVIKQMVEGDAKFLRFAGTDHLVIEVNGAEQTVTREFWRAIPLLDDTKDSKTVNSNNVGLRANEI